MHTIKETWQQGEAILIEAGIENARLDAQILCCFTMHIERSVLYAYPERIVSPQQEHCYLTLIARRQQHEPLAYITGHKEFYGLDFHVDPRVLIPRPETELLVEAALSSIDRRLNAGQTPIVADIGTGSGAIAITIAVAEPRLPYIYASDISPDALDVAHINAKHQHVAERIRIHQGHLIASLPEPIDILLANLPYVGTNEMLSMTPDVLSYEPHHALFSGPHGQDLLYQLCTDVQQAGILHIAGEMILEIGYQQGEVMARLIRELWPHANVIVRKDYAGYDRLVLVTLLQSSTNNPLL